MRTTERRIIREYDLKKLPKWMTKEYDIKFTPFTKAYFEKRVTYYSLKGKDYLVKQYMHYEYPESLLRRMTGFKLHFKHYKNWLVKYDDEGYLEIRAGLKQPASRLGFVTLKEKKR